MSETDKPNPTFQARLLRRDPDSFINEDGDVVVKRQGVQYQDGAAMADTFLANLSKLFRNAPRKTGRVDHLVIEAQLAEVNGGVGNPAEPIDAETERAAREQIDERGLTPAWEYDT